MWRNKGLMDGLASATCITIACIALAAGLSGAGGYVTALGLSAAVALLLVYCCVRIAVVLNDISATKSALLAQRQRYLDDAARRDAKAAYSLENSYGAHKHD